MANPPAPDRPLAGLLVLDLAENIAGSQAARLLAEAGARVVKAGDPAGSPLAGRPSWVGEPPARGILWSYVNRGKGVLNGNGGALAEALRSADVVVHSYPNAEAAREGLDSGRLRSLNQQIIEVSVTPYGTEGPRSSHQADDVTLMAASGLMYSTPGFPDFVPDLEESPPLRPSAEIAELSAGVLAAAACVEALVLRERTGSGNRVEVSVQEALASLLPWDLGQWNYGDILAGRREFRAGLSPNAFMPCADGWLVVVAFMEHHWRGLAEMMGDPDWAQSPLFSAMTSRGENWDALQPLLQAWLDTQRKHDVMREAQQRGIPTCAALEADEAFDNDQLREQSFLLDFQSGRLPGPVFFVNGRRVSVPEVDVPPEPRPLHDSGSDRGSPPEEVPGPSVAALEGLRIIDFGQIVAMPLAAQWMAFMGAEVIQVESRVNLPSRRFAPITGDPPENHSALYNHVNRSKRSVTINMKTPDGRELARRLAASADAVCENFSAGTMEKLGLGYDALKVLRPDIVMVSLSAFGRSGPWAHYNALHSGVMCLSGLAAVTGYEGGHPRLCGSILPDGLAACHATLAMVQALYHRQRTGEGQHVELSMSEVVQALLPEPIYEFHRYGLARPRSGNRAPDAAPHNVYRTKGEDRWLAISVRTEDEWARFCDAIGQPGLSGDERFSSLQARLANVEALDAVVKAWASTVTSEDAAGMLQARGVTAAPVCHVRDLLEDDHLRQREFIQPVSHPAAGCHLMPAKPWRLHMAPPPRIAHAPLLGDGNDYVLGEILGLSQSEMKNLEEQGVIY